MMIIQNGFLNIRLSDVLADVQSWFLKNPKTLLNVDAERIDEIVSLEEDESIICINTHMFHKGYYQRYFEGENFIKYAYSLNNQVMQFVKQQLKKRGVGRAKVRIRIKAEDCEFLKENIIC